MRWFKVSARDRILRDISFNKRGEAVSSAASRTGDSGGARSWGRNIFMMGLLLFILASVGTVMWFYINSEGGQRAIQDISASIQKFKAEFIGDYFGGLAGLGSGDYFSTNINSSSSKRGIDLEEFRAIAGETFPSGKTFDLLYDIEYYNVPTSSSYDGEFSCYFNVSKIGEQKIDPPERREGEIIPSSINTIRKGSTTFCRIPGELTADLDGAFTIFGGFNFDFATDDAVLPVYFIPGELADDLGEKDFFDAYDLDVSQSDLEVVYNGEPISVAMGVGGEGEGEEQQPVIVRSGESLSYNTVGITLTNEWNGDIADLTSLTLYLPSGITLSEELNGGASPGCPFISAGEERRRNMYIMDEGVRGELFTYYIQSKAFFGKSRYRTFQCWIEVDEDFFGDAPYVVKDFEIDVSYKYQVEEEQQTISIVPTGETLVVGEEKE